MGTDSLVNNTVAGANVDTSNFTVGSSASVQDIALAVGLESMNCYDQQIQTYYGIVHQENIEMQNMNNAMAKANAVASDGTKNSTSSATFSYTDPQTGATSTMSVASFMDKEGISRPSDSDNKYSTDEWNTVVSNLKTQLDNTQSMSQTDTMKLQSILNKQQESESASASIMKTSHDAIMDNISKF